MSDFTRAEVCAAAIADAFAEDGEIFGSPMGTLPMLGVRLAKLTSNPDLVISDGESLYLGGVPPIFAKGDVIEGWIPFRRVFDIVAYGRRHVMMGATQVDKHGNQNISAIGDHAKPKVQLLGVRGAPGNSVYHPTSYWVPKHSVRSFVPKVGMVSGVGNDNARAAGPSASRFHDLRVVVTDLGVLDYEPESGRLRIKSVHPGVTVDEVVAATGFDLVVPAEVPESRLPTAEALAAISTVIDPQNLRNAEVPA